MSMSSDPYSGMRFKSQEVFEEFLKLPAKSPALLGLMLYVGWMAQRMYGKTVCWTSIYRPTGNHSSWRMADMRLEGGRDEINDLTEQEGRQLVQIVNETYLYGVKSNGDPTTCGHPRLATIGSHPDKSNDHIHWQVPMARWKGRTRDDLRNIA